MLCYSHHFFFFVIFNLAICSAFRTHLLLPQSTAFKEACTSSDNQTTLGKFDHAYRFLINDAESAAPRIELLRQLLLRLLRQYAKS